MSAANDIQWPDHPSQESLDRMKYLYEQENSDPWSRFWEMRFFPQFVTVEQMIEIERQNNQSLWQ